VEIGYDVVAAERRKRCAREGIRAVAQRGSLSGTRVSASPQPDLDYAPSLALIRPFGVRQVGEQIDDADGLEHISECPAPAGRRAVERATATATPPMGTAW
jgi:hypothetical protein